MLILSRRVGEEIVIADDIRVKVLEVRGGQVRLGIQAPPTVRVVRTELLSPAAEHPNPLLVSARSRSSLRG